MLCSIYYFRSYLSGPELITSLENGLHSDAEVTVYVPLRDALNIFNNAQNINFVNFLMFAINVRTDPAHVKQDVIRKILSGK
ncbi:MAG: hypothetical protein ABIB71_01850 [Candidatus Woesearchaeota archaeon]